MRSAAAFAAGVLVALVAASFVLRPTQGAGDRNAVYWQQRAQAAERDLVGLRQQLEQLTTQLTGLTTRYDALSQRFQALSQTATAQDPAAATAPSASARPSPEGTPEPQPSAVEVIELPPIGEEQWQVLVGDTFRSAIERRLGYPIPPQREQRLLNQLQRLRDASRSLDVENLDAADPEKPGLEARRNAVLVEADGVFREELGVGVAEFLREVDVQQPQR